MNIKSGFTLIELVVTIAIAVVLAGFGIPAFRQYGARQELDTQAELVAEALREAQALSLAPERGLNYYGVEFAPPNYQIIAHKTASGDLVPIKSQSINSKVHFGTFLPDEAAVWIFKVNDQGRISADSVNQFIKFIIRLSHDRLPGEVKTIKGTAATGLIEIR